MDDEPPECSGVRDREVCLHHLEANLAKVARGIRGGDPEPEHPCASCDGHNMYCQRNIGGNCLKYIGVSHSPETLTAV